MATLWEIDGHLIEDGSLIECDDCPCGEVNCTVDTSLVVTIDGLGCSCASAALSGSVSGGVWTGCTPDCVAGGTTQRYCVTITPCYNADNDWFIHVGRNSLPPPVELEAIDIVMPNPMATAFSWTSGTQTFTGAWGTCGTSFTVTVSHP